MKFYSVVTRQSIEIPDSKVKYVVRGNKKFAVGEYSANGRMYEAWRVIGSA
jgi:outer membrane receptor for monomeric catechols